MKRVWGITAVILMLGAAALRAGPVDDRMTAGRAALADGLYDLAFNQFSAILAIDPGEAGLPAETVVAMVDGMGQALQAQGKYNEIFEWLDRSKKHTRRLDDAGVVYFWRGLAYYRLGKVDDALGEAADGLEKFPAGGYAQRLTRLRAWCLLKKGQSVEALGAFSASMGGDVADAAEARQRVEWAKALIASGKYAEAEQLFLKLTMGNGRAGLDGQYWYGRLLAEKGEWSAAISNLEAVATSTNALEDQRAEAWLSAAAVYRGQTNAASASDAYRQAFRLARDPEIRRRAGYNLGFYQLEQGDLVSGTTTLKALVAELTDAARGGEIQLKLADTLLDKGDAANAFVEYHAYLDRFKDPRGMALAHRGCGWSLFRLARFGEAATEFQQAFDLFKEPADKATCLFKLGDACFQNKQYQLAADAYRKVMDDYKDTPLAAEARFQYAECLARNNDAAGAEKEYRVFIEKFPQHTLVGEAWLRVAELNAVQRRYAEAVALFGRVVDDSNTAFRAEALFGRGMARYHLYAFQEAWNDLHRVTTEFLPSAVAEDAFYWSGMCLYWLGRDEEAVRSCQAFVERYPESQWTPAVMFWMGEIAFNQGRYEAAENQFSVFAEKYPLDGRAEEALLWAGRAAIQRAEYLHAIDVLGRLVKNYPGGRMVPDARFAQGEALSSLARFPEAILAFDEIINKYPASERFAEAWLRKGDCQFMLGAEDEKRYEEAVQSFRVAVSSPNVAPDELLQAEYKVGRCYEKQGKISAALEQYYTRVIVKFLDSRAKGLRPTESARTWFARAVYNAADILEARQEWRQVVSVLERLREVGMTVPAETEERIRRIRADHWLLF